jgi:hypothetical protein
VNLKNFPGACSKVGFLNSKCFVQDLRKSVENRIKFRKMHTKFFWIHGEKPYNFCKALPHFFLIVFARKIENL